MSGLHEIHRRGFVHLDLKTANIMVTIQNENVTLKITDFGLSKKKGETISDQVGTLTTMAPEVLNSEVHKPGATPANDVYSYGVVLWSMYFLKRPFQPMHGSSKPITTQETPTVRKMNQNKASDDILLERYHSRHRLPMDETTEC